MCQLFHSQGFYCRLIFFSISMIICLNIYQNTWVIQVTQPSAYHQLKSFQFHNSFNKISNNTHSGRLPSYHSDAESPSILNYTNGLPSTKTVVVLYWTKYFGGNPPYTELLMGISKCEAKFQLRCQLTTNRSLLNTANAVVFHARDLIRDDLPHIHHPQQLWVYSNQESPLHTRNDLHEFPDIFNWTMTYRKDSDVYHPYGKIVEIKKSTSSSDYTKQHNLLRKSIKNRKLVAMVVSNCQSPSKRLDLVAELRKYIPVYIYGECGTLKCNGAQSCSDEMALEYKFFLSFENSLCTQYITEKLYNALNSSIVPVVYGGLSRNDYSSIIPEGSYINVQNFGSAKELAEYLLWLDKNDEEYLRYYEWKRRYEVKAGDGFCNLCRKLAFKQNSTRHMSYSNVAEFERYLYSYPKHDWKGFPSTLKIHGDRKSQKTSIPKSCIM